MKRWEIRKAQEIDLNFISSDAWVLWFKKKMALFLEKLPN
jgi:hypothetical protein